MISAFSLGGFIGQNVEIVLLLSGGAYLAWVRPLRIRRQAARNQLSETEARTRLRKFKPIVGYCLFFAGVGQVIIEIIQFSGVA